jgi:hypothetical protein
VSDTYITVRFRHAEGCQVSQAQIVSDLPYFIKFHQSFMVRTIQMQEFVEICHYSLGSGKHWTS